MWFSMNSSGNLPLTRGPMLYPKRTQPKYSPVLGEAKPSSPRVASASPPAGAQDAARTWPVDTLLRQSISGPLPLSAPPSCTPHCGQCVCTLPRLSRGRENNSFSLFHIQPTFVTENLLIFQNMQCLGVAEWSGWLVQSFVLTA